jgi:RNA polymerase sigma factor for flagellar operon FliA
MDDPVKALVSQAELLLEPVARRLLRRLGTEAEIDELRSLGWPGVIEAAKSWDGRGSFDNFAAQRIKWSILDGLRAERRLGRARSRGFAVDLCAFSATERAADDFGRRWQEGDPAAIQDDEAALDAVLATAALDCAVDFIVAAGDLAVASDQSEDVEEQAERLHLRRAVHALPERERVVLERYSYGGETFKEIATSLGEKPSTIFDVHARAIELLRKGFAPDRAP